MNMEKNVILKDPEDKLYNIGFQDGKEIGLEIYKKNLPETVELKPQGPKRYLEGYLAGVKEAEKEISEKNSKKR